MGNRSSTSKHPHKNPHDSTPDNLPENPHPAATTSDNSLDDPKKPGRGQSKGSVGKSSRQSRDPKKSGKVIFEGKAPNRKLSSKKTGKEPPERKTSAKNPPKNKTFPGRKSLASNPPKEKDPLQRKTSTKKPAKEPLEKKVATKQLPKELQGKKIATRKRSPNSIGGPAKVPPKTVSEPTLPAGRGRNRPDKNSNASVSKTVTRQADKQKPPEKKPETKVPSPQGNRIRNRRCTAEMVKTDKKDKKVDTKGPLKEPNRTKAPSQDSGKPRALKVNPTLAKGYVWVTCTNGFFPKHAVEGGGIFHNKTLICSLGIARAYLAGQLIPGYFDTRENVCCVSWGGKPYKVKDQYQVLVALPGQFRWRNSEDGVAEPDAVIGGQTSDGENLLIGRAQGHILLHTFLATGRIQPSKACLLIANSYKLVAPKEEYDPMDSRAQFNLILSDEDGIEEDHSSYQYLAHPTKTELVTAVRSTRSYFSKSITKL